MDKTKKQPDDAFEEIVPIVSSSDSEKKEFVWEPKLQFIDGKVHELDLGEYESIYLRRKLTAQIAGSQKLSFSSGDAIKVWVNGREVFSKKIKRTPRTRLCVFVQLEQLEELDQLEKAIVFRNCIDENSD